MIGRPDCRGLARHCSNAAKIATYKITLLLGIRQRNGAATTGTLHEMNKIAIRN
jgi:hypothetical protein